MAKTTRPAYVFRRVHHFRGRVRQALAWLVTFQLIAVPAMALAADGTWQGTGADGNWATSGNWVGGVIPGATTGTTNPDNALFNSNPAQTTVTIDSGRNLGGLTFDTSAGAFTIGGAGANAGNSLLLSSGGLTQITSGLSGSGITQTFNAPLVLEPATATSAGSYTFSNSSSTTSNIFSIAGGISGGATASNVTLNLGGSNTGANAIGTNQSTNYISDGAAAGGLALATSGGTWTVNGNNSFTGGTTISGGTVITNTDTNLGPSANTVTLTGGGAWELGGGINGTNSHPIVLGTGGGTLIPQGDTRFTGTINGGTGLTVTGGGDFLPAPSAATNIGTLTITGNTRVLTGFGAAGNNNFIANNAVLVTNGGNLDFGSGGSLNLNNAMTFGPGSALSERNTAVTLNNVTLPSSGTMIFQVDDTNPAQLITINSNWTPLTGDLTIQAGGNNSTGATTINGTIDGAFGVTKTGPNTLTLAGNNSFSGGLTVAQGTLAVSTVNNAGTNGPLGNNTSVTLGSSGNTGTLEYTGGTASSNMPFTLATGGTGGFQVDTAGTNLTLTGAITGDGAFSKTGAGTLTLAGANTSGGSLPFSGGMNLGAGTVEFDLTSGLNISNNLSGNGTLLVTGSSTLTLSGNNNGFGGTISATGGTVATTNGANLGGGTLALSNGAAWNFSGNYNQNVVLGTGGAVFNGSGDIGFTGTITGGTSLTFNSGDLLASPSGPNDIGTLNIAGGRILMTGGGGNFLANNVAVNVTGGLGLDFGQGGTLSFNNPMTFASGSGLGERNGTNVTLGSNTTLPSSGTFFLSNDDTNTGGFITLNTNLPLTGDLAVTLGSSGNTNGSAAINGVISGSSNLTVSAVNAGGSNTLFLGGANTLSGTTTINSGAVELANASALLYSPVVVNANNGLAFANAINYTIASLSGTGGFSIPTGTTLTVGNGSTSYNTNYSGNLSGGGALVQAGPGTLTLSGNNNGMSGNMTVSGGTLVTTGDGNLNSGTLTISTGGDWQASNGSSHAIVAAGGTWSPQGDFFFNGTITGGGGLTFNSGDLLPAPASPTDIGTITITGSGTRILTFFNNNFIANNTVNVVNGGNLDIGSGGNLTLNNTMSFASGTSFGQRGTNVTVDTGTVTFPSAGMMTFQNDDTNSSGLMTVTGNWPTLTGPLTLQVGTGGNPGALELTGVISDGGAGFGLTKTGPNTLILGGANTFSGDTLISNGSIQLNNTLALQNSNVTDNASSGLTFGAAGNYTIPSLGGTGGAVIPTGVTLTVGNGSTMYNTTLSGNLSGGGSLTQAGPGTLTISGNNSGLSGGVSITGGTLATIGNNALGSGTLSISNDAIWQPTGNATYANNIVLGTGGGTLNGVFNGGSDIFLQGTVTGGTGLNVTGGDILPTSNAASDIGTLTISNARVLMFGSGFLANNTVVNVNSGGTLDFGMGGTQTPLNTMTFASGSGLGQRNGTPLNLGSNVTFPSAGTFALQNDDVGGNNLITMSGSWPLTGNLALTLGNVGTTVGNVQVDGLVSGSGGFTLATVNAGSNQTLILTNANTFTGTTTINSGFVQDANSLGLALQNSTVVINQTNGLTFAPGINTFTLGGLAGTANEALTNVTSLIVGNNSLSTASNTYSGVLSGGASYTEVGLGSQTLSGLNTYTGPTTVSGGTLIAGNDVPNGGAGAFGNATSAILLGDVNTTANNWSPSLEIGGAFTVDRAITIANQSTSGTYTIGGSTDNSSTFSGPITLNNALTVSQVATTGSHALNITGGISAGSSAGEIVTFAGPGHINVGGSGISDGSGSVGVNVTGGKVVLSGANSYTGATNVNGGTLQVDGSLASGSAVTVNAGGTIGGHGTIGGSLNIANGGTLSPGDSPGILTAGSTNWSTGGNYNWQLHDATAAAGVGFDQLVVNGTLTIQPGFNFNTWTLSGVSPDIDGPALHFDPLLNHTYWVVATATGGIIGGANLGSANIFVRANNGAGGIANFLGGTFILEQGGVFGNPDTNPNDVDLIFVPEPSGIVLMLLGLIGCLGLARRRIVK